MKKCSILKKIGQGNFNMKFYFIPRVHVSKIPFDLYKDNTVAVVPSAYVMNVFRILKINYSHYPSVKHNPRTELYLFNLVDEDLLHLNLLGVHIKKSSAVEIPELTKTINSNSTKFDVEVGWDRKF